MNIKTVVREQVKDISPVALHLFLLIWSEEGPVTLKWVQDEADLSYRTANKYLNELLEKGWLEHPTTQQWCLPSGQQFLPGLQGLLPNLQHETIEGEVAETSILLEEKVDKKSILPEDQEPKVAEMSTLDDEPNVQKGQLSSPKVDQKSTLDLKVEKMSTFPLTTTTTCKHDLKEKKSVSSKKVVVVSDDQVHVSAALKKAFKRAGVGRNAWEAIVRANPGITPEYVRKMQIRVFHHEPLQKRNVGFLVHCLTACDDEPDVCLECRGLGQHTPECSEYVPPHRRYAPEVSPEAYRMWNDALEELRLQLDSGIFSQWLQGTEAIKLDDGVLWVNAGNIYAKEWLDERLRPTIDRAMQIVTDDVQVRFVE